MGDKRITMKLQSGSTKPRRDVVNKEKLERAANLILDAIEGDKRREGTERTPERIARDWGELFEGYNYDVDDILNRTFDSEKYDELVLVNTNFTSTCEHHILPFRGTAWVGYVPGKRIVGLDKLIKLVWMFSKRLQNQERITKQVAEAIQEKLKPMGVMVVLKATHDCISLRGTGAVSETVTSACFGIFRNKAESREEFLDLIKL
jgi:GTP cyclohydrolase I